VGRDKTQEANPRSVFSQVIGSIREEEKNITKRMREDMAGREIEEKN